MARQSYKFSREEIARHKCRDCGVNVLKAGDYYMLSSNIWRDQFGLGWDDNLCIACAEARLGRKLRMEDFESLPPPIEGFPISDTLLDRYGSGKAKAQKKARKRVRRKSPS
jgi:hypothetical protein